MGSIDYDLIMPPKLFKESPGNFEIRRGGGRSSCLDDLLQSANSINRIEQVFLCWPDGKEQISVGMRLVNQDGSGSGRQPLLYTDGVRHSNGHVGEAGIAGKTNFLRRVGTIARVSSHAMAKHRSAKQFDGGELFR